MRNLPITPWSVSRLSLSYILWVARKRVRLYAKRCHFLRYTRICEWVSEWVNVCVSHVRVWWWWQCVCDVCWCVNSGRRLVCVLQVSGTFTFSPKRSHVRRRRQKVCLFGDVLCIIFLENSCGKAPSWLRVFAQDGELFKLMDYFRYAWSFLSLNIDWIFKL